MFNNWFNRVKLTSATPKKPEVVALETPALMLPAPVVVVPKEQHLEAFRDGWEDQWESSHEVIEGNGGHTDWGEWTQALEEEERAFAPTMPMAPK